jgi:hypothetical protein
MPNSKPSRNAEYLSNAQLSQASSPTIAHSILRRPNLIKDPGPASFDDRRASIEIQIRDEVMLPEMSVELVVLPTQYLSNTFYLATMVDHWGAEIRDYSIYHDRPNSYVGQIRAEVEKYYREEGYI